MGLVNKDQKTEFPVGPVDETPHSQCRRTYSTPRWGSQVPHTTTQPRSPSWTGHSEDTGLLKQETEARRRKTALKTSHQRTRPTAKRATDPRRQPDPHPPFTEPQTLPTWARGAVQNQDGTWPWTGYHLPHQRQESLQPVPLLRSLPRSTPFPDPAPGQDTQHPVLPAHSPHLTPGRAALSPPRPFPTLGRAALTTAVTSGLPTPQGAPLPLMQVRLGVHSPPDTGGGWVGVAPTRPQPQGRHGHRGGPGCRTSGESAPTPPSREPAAWPHLAARTQLRPQSSRAPRGQQPHPQGGHGWPAGPCQQGLSPTCHSEMILLTRTWTSAGSGNTLRPPGGASGGTVVLTSQPRPQAKVDQCR